MKQRLLTSVAAAALIAGTAGAASAQQFNTAFSALGSAAVASEGPAVENGAIGGSNALGQDANGNAAAYQNSNATSVNAFGAVDAVATDNSTAVENGAAVGGDGAAVGDSASGSAASGQGAAVSSNSSVVDEGSALLIGDGNQAAAAEDGSAAANNNSAAAWAGDDNADNGSSLVLGDRNNTASAETGSAAVGNQGTAVGIYDVDIFGDDVTAAFGEGNVVAAAHLEEVTIASTQISVFAGFFDGFNFNAFADAAGVAAVGPNAAITTGNINHNNLGALSGANMFAGNTGLANQGDAVGVAATNSF